MSKEKVVQSQHEILEKLLNEINVVDFRAFLNLPENENIKQKHLLVGIIKNLSEVAKANQWSLCKSFDYTYIYSGQYWKQLDKDDLKDFLGKCAAKMGCPDYDAAHYEFKDKLLKQFLTDCHLSQPVPDENKMIINLQNGTFEFENDTWTLREFNSADFMTYQLPFCYDETATCPMFNSYLDKVLPDKESRMILQEFAGYIFTKLNLEKMLMLTGSGQNGKSVFFDIICALLGRENVLQYTLGAFSSEYNRAKLTDVLLNYSSEKGTDVNPDTFKALVSGEPLQAREPYGRSFTLHNTVRFIINANELPSEIELTDAFFRRWIIIPFEVQISEEEKDIDLSKKIIANELAGVFNWLLGGLDRIVKNRRFTHSEKVNNAIGEFKWQSDKVNLFIDEFNYTASDTNKVHLSDLYKDYKQFCQDDGYKPLGKNKFSKKLENKKFEKSRASNGSICFGMASAQSDNNSEDNDDFLIF